MQQIPATQINYRDYRPGDTRYYGRMVGVEQAEGFMSNKFLL